MKTFILAIAVLVGGTSMAQQQEKREPKTAEQRAAGMTEKMTAKLSLDDAQKAKIQDINLGIAKKNDAIRQNASLTREQKFAQMKENQDARKAQYKEVLSADQYAKYEAWEKEKQEKMQAKRAERQESPKGGKGEKGSKGTKQTPPTQETEEL
ncbi:hypothetical protein [Fluviicola sp.]|uniref:hypothetical protein n=1 Tax=Fluviicola sp. TaxID=1917219 RepID=UPI00263143F2|nr:hypothetical protein [Fluviicola sp.]